MICRPGVKLPKAVLQETIGFSLKVLGDRRVFQKLASYGGRGHQLCNVSRGTFLEDTVLSCYGADELKETHKPSILPFPSLSTAGVNCGKR